MHRLGEAENAFQSRRVKKPSLAHPKESDSAGTNEVLGAGRRRCRLGTRECAPCSFGFPQRFLASLIIRLSEETVGKLPQGYLLTRELKSKI